MKVGEDFHCLGFLSEPGKEVCNMIQARIDSLRDNGAFEEEVETQLPKPNQRIDCISPTWVCLYEHPFSLGLKFPFPKLITDFFHATKLAYVQLMPQGWRVLVTMMKVSERHGIDLGLEELAYCYYLRPFGSYRYFFRTRHGRKALVLKIENNDRGWKRKFFFVAKESVDEEVLLPTGWNTEGVNLATLFPENDGTKARVEAVLELPEIERTFSSEAFEGKPINLEEDKGEEVDSDSESKSVTDPQLSTKMSAGSKTTRLGKRFSLEEVNSLIKKARVKIEKSLPPQPPKKSPEVIETKDTSVGNAVSESEKVSTNNVFKGVKFEDMGEKIVCEATKKVDGVLKEAFVNLKAERHIWMEKLKSAENEKMFLKKRMESEAEIFRAKTAQTEKDLEESLLKLSKYEEAHLQEIQEIKKYYQTSAAKAMIEGRIEMIKEFNQGLRDKWNLGVECQTLKMLDEDDDEADPDEKSA